MWAAAGRVDVLAITDHDQIEGACRARQPLEAWSSEETSGLRRVLVPLDGSPVAEAIIPFVSRIARPLGLEIALLRAVPAIAPRVIEGGRHIVIDNTERLRQEADDYLRAIADPISCASTSSAASHPAAAPAA